MTLTSVGTGAYVHIPAHIYIIKNYINFSKACTPDKNSSRLPQRGGALEEHSRALDSELQSSGVVAFVVLETGSYYIALTGLELAM